MSTKASGIVSPSKMAHAVFRTNNLKEMSSFYQIFLGGEAVVENEESVFITYDDEHHRIAIVQRPDLKQRPLKACGLDHIAFGFEGVESFLKAYAQRKEHDIKPIWCVHHGLTISMYYKDPDGNTLETFIDAFDDLEKQNAYIASEDFAENRVGVDYDPEDLMKRIEGGEAMESIYKRPRSGPRNLDTIPSFYWN